MFEECFKQMSLTIACGTLRNNKCICIRLGAIYETAQVDPDGATSGIFQQRIENCQWAWDEAEKWGSCRLAENPATGTCHETSYVHRDGPVVGLQWACNGAAIGSPWDLQCDSAMGITKSKAIPAMVSQWACNGLAMGLQRGLQWDYVRFLFYLGRKWVDPIAGPLQAHCRNRSARTNSHPSNPLQTS